MATAGDAVSAEPPDQPLRRRETEVEVTYVELFFDLVYVLAVTQLTDLLLGDLSPAGGAKTLILLFALWWAWVDTAWVTNWFDPDRPSVRTMLVAVMLLSLVMASVLPEAYHHDGLWFAAAYVAVQVGRTAAVVLLLRGAHRLRRNFVRILVWRSVSGVFWLLGAFLPAGARIVCWGVAVVIDLTAAAVGFYLPTLGSANTDQWRISGGHLAERCQLFVMIALGESILVIGADFGGLRIRPLNALALAVAFFATVAFWWIYFDRTADAASEAISNSGDPGRLGRSAFTYYHVPMVAGIIVTAAGDELMISDPGVRAGGAVVATIYGGAALFLVGHGLFKRSIFGRYGGARFTGAAVLLILVPLGMRMPALGAYLLALTVLVGVIVAEESRLRRRQRRAGAGEHPNATGWNLG